VAQFESEGPEGLWDNERMATQPKRPVDLNQLAAAVVGDAVGEPLSLPKNQARAEAGRLGGLKGGHERAAKLSQEKLSEIGKKGAKARWGHRQDRDQEATQGDPTSGRS
jgi:hypothetical protein